MLKYDSTHGRFNGTVEVKDGIRSPGALKTGDLSIYHVRLKSGQMISAQLQNEHRYRKGLPTWGDEVRLCWDADSCVVLTV
jgi:ABC-type Fe3+/spermidine/putrescine transport system ATPase subunit